MHAAVGFCWYATAMHQPAPRTPGLDALARARDGRAALDAVDQLRAALWEDMLAALHAPAAEDVAVLADRLARLCSALLRASLEGAEGDAATVAEGDAGAVADGDAGPGAEGDAAAGADTEQRYRREPAAEPLEQRTWGRGAAHGDGAFAGGEPPAATRTGERAGAGLVGEIAARDQRASADAGAPWIAAIERELRDFEHEHHPFAVLLVEPRDLGGLVARLAPRELERFSAALERAVRELLGREAVVERPGRLWLIAPGFDAAAASALAERLAAAFPLYARIDPSAAGLREVLIGVALCPPHARGARALAAHAEVDLYAARRPFPAGV